MQQAIQGPPPGPGPGPGQGAGWEPFFRQQRRQRAARDGLSSAVLVVILSALAFRIQGDVALWELLHHAVLMALAVLSATDSQGPTYASWRNVVAVALRLGTASSPLVVRHAIQMLQVGVLVLCLFRAGSGLTSGSVQVISIAGTGQPGAAQAECVFKLAGRAGPGRAGAG